MFGGQDGEQVFSDIYILDLGTSVWKKGSSELEPRTEMACAMSGDGFLIWGGRLTILGLPHGYNMVKSSRQDPVILLNRCEGLAAGEPSQLGASDFQSHEDVMVICVQNGNRGCTRPNTGG